MANDIDDAFVTQYDREITLRYQRMGAKLNGTVRTVDGVEGNTITFQRLGTGTASTKGRNSQVTPMNPSHETASATMSDFYAGQWIDKLDLLKIRHDERAAVQQTAVAALGRQEDKLTIDVLEAATTNQSTARNLTALSSTATAGTVIQIFATHVGALGRRDVPLDDGNVFSAVSMQVWENMLTHDQFARAEYVGMTPYSENPWRMRRWLGVNWFNHTGLTLSGTSRYILTWHKNAVGKGVGTGIQTDMTWHGDRAAWFFNSMISAGSVVIEPDGVQQLLVNEGA